MKKVKAIAAVAATVALSALLVGCASGGSSSSSSAASSSSSASSQATSASFDNKLIVGFDNSYPPYGFIGDDGNYTGLDLDLAQAVADINGWELECMPIDWDAKDALLNQGTINCIWNGFTMENREDDYTFSDPYMLNQQVVVVRADSGITTEEDLADKVVITQIDSAALDVLEDGKADLAATFRQLDTISDYNNAFMQLEAGTVDAVACDLSIAAYQMSANPDKYVQLATPLSDEHYAVGFAKTDEGKELAEKVNASLKEITDNGKAKEICEDYAEYGVDYSNWIIK